MFPNKIVTWHFLHFDIIRVPLLILGYDLIIVEGFACPTDPLQQIMQMVLSFPCPDTCHLLQPGLGAGHDDERLVAAQRGNVGTLPPVGSSPAGGANIQWLVALYVGWQPKAGTLAVQSSAAETGSMHVECHLFGGCIPTTAGSHSSTSLVRTIQGYWR